MINIQTLSIQTHGFQILPILNYFDLTTGYTTYKRSPNDGGIKVIPKLEIQNIAEGYFYITQVCKMHELVIVTDNDNKYSYSSNEEMRDTPIKSQRHYNTWKIVHNQIKDMYGHDDHLYFFDAPFRELFAWWKEYHYNIQFQTWFQYSEGSTPQLAIKPIMSFNWNLNASVSKEKDVWKINQTNFSDEQKIRESIVYYQGTDLPKIPCKNKHLLTEVHNFSLLHSELRTDYQP